MSTMQYSLPELVLPPGLFMNLIIAVRVVLAYMWLTHSRVFIMYFLLILCCVCPFLLSTFIYWHEGEW
jgi:hypothetical protein